MGVTLEHKPPEHDDITMSISCDECVMQHTAVCGDCVVSFVLGDLDGESARVIQLFGAAGMVPELRFQRAGP